MCLLVGVNQLGFGAMVPSLPLYASSFGVSASAIGLAVAMYGLARFVAILPGGQLADRWGRRPVLAIGGLKEKSIAAYREGMDTVLYPEGNKKDLADIPEDIKNRLKLIPVKHMEQVVSLALGAKFPS